MSTPRSVLVVAAVLLGIATALGAFGTHALKPMLSETRFESFETAVHYQFFHALGLVGLALLRRESAWDSSGLRAAGWLLLLGILLFSGSIYALTFGAPRVFGMVAPFGGASLMAAWALVALSLVRTRTAR